MSIKKPGLKFLSDHLEIECPVFLIIKYSAFLSFVLWCVAEHDGQENANHTFSFLFLSSTCVYGQST